MGTHLTVLFDARCEFCRAVRTWLAEFLHDHRVVQMTRWLWCPLLHFLILPLRGPRVARKYAEIWMDRGDLARAEGFFRRSLDIDPQVDGPLKVRGNLEITSGTGRVVDVTCTVGRPVRRVRSASKRRTSPNVADMRMNWQWGSCSNGTCHAHPRSGSA